MVNNQDVHAVSVVDLVVADWKGFVQGTCWYLQCEVSIMSVQTSFENTDGCQQLMLLKAHQHVSLQSCGLSPCLFTQFDKTCQCEAYKGLQTKNFSSIVMFAIL